MGSIAACLVDAHGNRWPLRTDIPNRIGRTADNELAIADPTVSQHHAVLSFDAGRAFIRDLNSSNGTFLHGTRISGARLTSGAPLQFGAAAFVYREEPAIYIPPPPIVRAVDPGRWLALRNLIPGRKAAAVAAAALVVAVLLMRMNWNATAVHPSSSATAGIAGTTANLLASQDFRLPNATSDFVGDWCGWERTVACNPADSCDDDPAPISLSFSHESGWLGGSGGVVLHYEVYADADTEVTDIHVQAPDARHVEVSFTLKGSVAAGLEFVQMDQQQLVSVDSAHVHETDHYDRTLNGILHSSRDTVTELQKCSQSFEETQDEWQKSHGYTEKGEVNGNVP